MKIAYLSGSYLPSRQANSIHVMRMTSAMAELGHDVVLYGYVGDSTVPDQQLADYYGVDQRVRIQRLVPRRTRIGRELKYAWQLRSLVASQGPDLVYGRHLLSLLSCARNAPTIYETHAARDGVNSFLEARLLQHKNLKAVIAITHALADAVQSKRALGVPISVEPDAVSPINYASVEPVSLDGDGRLKVGYCGHLYPGRGAEQLIEIACLRPQYDFHIVGGEPSDLNRVSALATNVRNIKFHGFVPPHQVPSYLAAFDVLVAPYQRRISPYGGGDIARWISPMKLFEYMDAGKAIVISNLPAIAEVIEDNQHVLLVDPESVKAWCHALDRLDSPNLRRHLGSNASNLVHNKYTWKKRAKRILDQFASREDSIQ